MALNVKTFAKLVSWFSYSFERELTTEQLNELYNAVEDIGKVEVQQSVSCDVNQIHIMLEAMQAGRKIDAIKAHRQLTGYGLKESKDAIDKYSTYSVNVELPVDLQGRYRFERNGNTLRVIAI